MKNMALRQRLFKKAIRDVISIINEEAPEKSRGSLKKDYGIYEP